MSIYQYWTKSCEETNNTDLQNIKVVCIACATYVFQCIFTDKQLILSQNWKLNCQQIKK